MLVVGGEPPKLGTNSLAPAFIFFSAPGDRGGMLGSGGAEGVWLLSYILLLLLDGDGDDNCRWFEIKVDPWYVFLVKPCPFCLRVTVFALCCAPCDCVC